MEHEPLIVSLKQKGKTPEVPSTRSRKKWWALTVLVFVGLCIVGGYYGYPYVYKADMAAVNTRTQSEASEEIADTILRVSELIVLPEGEEPTIATVTDPEKLKDQAFFANAKPGHRVLLYTKARKAFLYDPVAHRLIEVAPITTELQ